MPANAKPNWSLKTAGGSAWRWRQIKAVQIGKFKHRVKKKEMSNIRKFEFMHAGNFATPIRLKTLFVRRKTLLISARYATER
mmetsp:Transcript_58993/g.111100  ORF Transcript_58993/g.111100 Transcript_58993/m.111100 type:complete len:82 (+) Transcript_58993:335-580(+)